MVPIQILLVLFFLTAIIKVFQRLKSKELPPGMGVLWILFWIVAAVIVIQPNVTFYFAKLFGVGRGADVVVYAALAALFFMVFRLMVRIEQLNRDITKLVRDNALKK